MTQEEIIEMAMEAEFVLHGKPSEEESELFVCVDKDIVRFANLVAAKERETLAQTQEPKIGCVNHDCDKCKAQRTWVGLDHQDKKKFSSWLDHKTDDEVFTAIDNLLREMNT